MAKRNIYYFEDMSTKFYDKMNTVRKFDGSSNRGRFRLVPRLCQSKISKDRVQESVPY